MKKEWEKALEVFLTGGIVIFPTDTVMGIGCIMSDVKAIKKLYEIKKRPFEKPTSVLASNKLMAGSLINQKMDKELKNIMKKYWPGALTIIVRASEIVPKEIMGYGNKVGIRIPKFQRLQKLISCLGCPIVASSANFSNDKTPLRFKDINKSLIEKVDFVIREDSLGLSASTVIEYLGSGKYKYIRKGDVVL